MTNSKKLISLSAMILTIAATSISAFAFDSTTPALTLNTPATKVITNKVNSNYTVQNNCFDLMLDENGAFVNNQTFESNLDEAIKSGTIDAGEKDYYMSLYSSCTSTGRGCCSTGARSNRR